VETRRFREADDVIIYPEGGAFVEFLVERYGWPKVQNLYRAVKVDASAADFGAAFGKACGEELDSAEGHFKSWAQSGGE